MTAIINTYTKPTRFIIKCNYTIKLISEKYLQQEEYYLVFRKYDDFFNNDKSFCTIELLNYPSFIITFKTLNKTKDFLEKYIGPNYLWISNTTIIDKSKDFMNGFIKTYEYIIIPSNQSSWNSLWGNPYYLTKNDFKSLHESRAFPI